MVKIFCVTSGLTGILRASLGLCKSLQGLGYTVHYTALKNVADFVQRQGVQWVDIHPFPLEYTRYSSYKKVWEAWHLDDWKEHLTKGNYDLVLIDMEMHEWIIGCEEAGQHFILLSQWFPIWPNDHAPSPNTILFPGSPEQNRSTWKNLYRKRFWLNLKRSWGGWKMTRRGALRTYMKKKKMDLDSISWNGWPPPCIHTGKETWTMTNASVDFPGNARNLDVFLGAQIDTERKDVSGKEEQEWKQRLENLGDRKLIICTLSTMNESDTEHVERIIKVMPKHENWELWVTTGGKTHSKWDNLPDNVHQFDWIPQLMCLERADVSIHHGGIHTINECIHHQVPQLVYSGERHDQSGCAARVAYHGLGILGSKMNDDVARVELYLIQLLENNVYRSALEHHHKEYKSLSDSERLDRIVKASITSKKK